MKTCDRCHTNPATSRSAKYCLACRKIRQSENGIVQGKRNAALGMVWPDLPEDIDYNDEYIPPRT